MPVGRLTRALHGALVFRGRTERLAELLSNRIPAGSRVLDIGCGDGTVSALITARSEGVHIEGVELKSRQSCKIECKEFDGQRLPYADGVFDVCMFVDVLHHTPHAKALLKEAARVSSRYVLIKDHLSEGRIDNLTLKFMDWVGNRPYGVVLEYLFASKAQWDEWLLEAGLSVANWDDRLKLYPQPADAIFGRGLHFVALLEVRK